jgi:hypothetical protein
MLHACVTAIAPSTRSPAGQALTTILLHWAICRRARGSVSASTSVSVSADTNGDDGKAPQAKKRPRIPNVAGRSKALGGARKVVATEATAPKKRRNPPQHCMPVLQLMQAMVVKQPHVPESAASAAVSAPTPTHTLALAKVSATVRKPAAQAEPSEDPYKRQYSASRGGVRQRATTRAPLAEPQVQQLQRRRRRQPAQPQQSHDPTGSEPNKYVCGCGRSFGKAAWLGNHAKACKLSSPRGAGREKAGSPAGQLLESVPPLSLSQGEPTIGAVGEANAASLSMMGAIGALHREVSARNSPSASQAAPLGARIKSLSAVATAAAAADWQVPLIPAADSGRSFPATVADEAIASTQVQHCVQELVKSVIQGV